MAHGVVDEVGREALSEPGVAQRGRLAERAVHPQPAALGSELARRDGLAGHGGQVEWLTAVETPLAACQGQQRLDQPFLLLAGGQHPLTDRLQRADGGFRVPLRDLDQGPLPGQRRTRPPTT